MKFEEIRSYWDERARGDQSSQSTTQDHYLREIEYRAVAEQISKHSPHHVVDIGCGDARTTARLACDHPEARFTGIDYAQGMIDNAKSVVADAKVQNLKLQVGDVCSPIDCDQADFIYTNRCLINLPEWDLQQKAIANIHERLAVGGIFAMVENYVEGQNNFNAVRETYGLPPINIRGHNKFFEIGKLKNYLSGKFDVISETNISSTYYLVSRVIYSKICQEQGFSPDYFDDHHRLAADLPFSGEFGPVRLVVLRKI